MFKTLAELLEWYLYLGKTECHVCEDHYSALKKTSYYQAPLADEYTVCIWKIKLKQNVTN